MTTLAEHMIVAGAENHSPMLEKSMYDSWASCIRLFIKGKKNGRMMLASIDEGTLVYPTVAREDGQTRPKKYSELTEEQQLQDDCDVQATNIILHGLQPDVYSLGETLYEYYWRFSQLINDMHTMTMQQVQVNTKFLNALPPEWSKFVTDVKLAKMIQQSHAEFPQLDSGLVVPTFQQGEDPIDCINKAMTFLSDVASRFPSSTNQLKTSSNPRNQATIQDGRVTVQQCTQPKRPRNSTWFKEKLMLVEAQEAGQILDEEQLAFIVDPGIEKAQVAQQKIPQNSTFQTEDLDAYDLDCDDISSAKAVLMANISSCDSDVLSEVPYSDTYPSDMINQDVQEMPYSEQTHIVDFPDNKITSDSNIIPYS
ncbi:hypothetical protein Tco_0998674 [Tanacetum coccineum]